MPGHSGGAAGLPYTSPAAAAAFLHEGYTPSCQDSDTRHPGTSAGPCGHSSLYPALLRCWPAGGQITQVLVRNYLEKHLNRFI